MNREVASYGRRDKSPADRRPAATPAAPAWMTTKRHSVRRGDNTVEPRSGILFVADGDIFLIQPDGSGRTQLTHSRRSESDPRWSPDGRRIAFVRLSDAEGYPDEGAEVYVMNADGSNPTRLTAGLLGDSR
jgi:dipeptidyl aminopeptidase/acylaminoacyl peptidase